MRGRRRLVVAAGIVAVLAAGCGVADEEASESAAVSDAPTAAGDGEGGGVGGSAAAVEEDILGLGAAPLPGLGSAVIKDAALGVEVERDAFDEALQRTTGIAAHYGGYLLSSQVGETEEARRGSVVLAIPTDSFERALGDARRIGDVRSESVSGEDVSQEVIDLHARLRNLEAQETVMLRLMRRADTITETIQVQEQLSVVQLEIERIRGRLAYAEERTTFGSLSVDLFEAGEAPAPPGDDSVLARSLAWSREVMMGMAGVAIVAVAVGGPPAVLGLLGWLLYRRMRRRPKPAAPVTSP